MQFSNFLAFLALASIGVQASPTINSRPNALEKRAAREETNYEVAIEHGLPKDAKEKTLYAFEMVSPVKTTPPEDVHVDLNRLTTNKGGSHSRLVVGYKSGEKEFSADCFDLILDEKPSKEHPNGNGIKVSASKNVCSWKKGLRSTLKYLGEVENEKFKNDQPQQGLTEIRSMARSMAGEWGPQKNGEYDVERANCFTFVDELWNRIRG